MRTLNLLLCETEEFLESEPDPSLFESANLARFYFPERGILYSFLVHVIIFAFLIMYPLFNIPPVEPIRFPERPVMGRYFAPKVLVYLPLVGGGSPGGGLPGPRAGRVPGKPSAASIPGSKGMSHPGPQRILSDVPNATNRVQTLLQPGLKNPPPLKLPLRLPNIVRMADLGAVPRLELPRAILQAPKPAAAPPAVRSVVPVMPMVALSLPKPVAAPRMILPASLPPVIPAPDLKPQEAETPAPKSASIPEPSRIPAEQTKVEPLIPTSVMPKEHPAQEISSLPGGGTDRRNLLALSPFPTIPEEATAIPLGEARGRFAISPEPGPGGPDDKLGSNIEGSSPTAGIGNQASASAKAGTQMGKGSGAGVASGTGAGGGGGNGTGSGTGGPGRGSGIGAGSGSGSGTGSGSGSGTGTGSGSGTGAGSGSGKGAFSGISIIGGVGATGTSRGAAPRPTTPPRPLQTSYGLTIIATGNSGGGLPLYDVFSQEEVYTVYLDMRRTETDTAPSWPLEFALLKNTTSQAQEMQDIAGRNPQWLVLPFPAYKDVPALPADLVRKYRGGMIVVYAIINVEGKLEQLTIKSGPEARLNEIVLNALKRWIFKPARVRGEPVAAKVLLGIPMWLPE